MKRFGCMFLMFILSVFYAGIALAVEVTVFEEQYARTRGEANSYADTFFGFPGNGKLIIINGYENGKNRISDAEIEINGSVVVGSDDFNQKVYRIEVPVALDEDNSISVKLESVPGSFLTVQVVQEATEIEASAIIGPEGGVVEVTDPNSTLYGTKVEVPSGALTTNSLFTISTMPEGIVPPYDNVIFDDGINIESSENLSGKVLVTYPLKIQIMEHSSIAIATYNNEFKNWSLLPYLEIDYDNNIIKFNTNHFSPFKGLMSTNELPSLLSPKFNFKTDSFKAPNENVCLGMSAFSVWHYKKYGHGLRCLWDEEKSREIAIQAQSEIYSDSLLNESTLWLTWDKIESGIIEKGSIDILKIKLNADEPQVLGLSDTFQWPSWNREDINAAHAVLVIGYNKVNNDLYELYCYDPNHPYDPIIQNVPYIITAEKKFWGWKIYHPEWPENGTVFITDFWKGLSPEFEEIKDDHEPDNWCDNNEPIVTGKIPDTGQTASYTDTFGEDSDYNINPQSYTKLGYNGVELPYNAQHVDTGGPWIMTRDNVTGLVWEVKGKKDGLMDYSNPNDADNTYTWYDTEDFIATLNATNFGGYSDWRMPTVKELSFIRSMGRYNLAINTYYFLNTMLHDTSSIYWSSTSSFYIDRAWRVGFYLGDVRTKYRSDNSYVRAVRGGQPTALNSFVINGDGTVTDTETGMMWQQWEVGRMKWESALAYCENLELAGYDDWRLPNINELQSIVDYSTHTPAIDANVFPAVLCDVDVNGWPIYWSSTSCFSYPGMSWGVEFISGYMAAFNGKSENSYVRCVRGGR